MEFKCVHFRALSLDTLYSLLTLRQAVFVVEQDCPYLDNDGKDLVAHHAFLEINDVVVACTRILGPGISYSNYASIGRVANAISVRGKGIGKELMKFSIQQCNLLYPGKAIKISAQVYLLKFYEELGFKNMEEYYLEDDIPHVGMVYK